MATKRDMIFKRLCHKADVKHVFLPYIKHVCDVFSDFDSPSPNQSVAGRDYQHVNNCQFHFLQANRQFRVPEVDICATYDVVCVETS
ncbi:hypothetical protein Plhal304r1_c133g0176731 [Plasmopara halstedii]